MHESKKERIKLRLMMSMELARRLSDTPAVRRLMYFWDRKGPLRRSDKRNMAC